MACIWWSCNLCVGGVGVGGVGAQAECLMFVRSGGVECKGYETGMEVMGCQMNCLKEGSFSL